MQGQLDFSCPVVNDDYMQLTIWQPETKCIPWAVHVEGYRKSGVNVWLYHAQIRGGCFFYKKCRFKDAYQFVNLIRSQVCMFKNLFKYDIEIRGIDYRALYDGWRGAENKAAR